MAKYRFELLESQHIEADKSKPVLGPDGKPTGRFEKKTYTKGQLIDTDTDLATKLGANKFRPVGNDGGQARIAELEAELAAARAALGPRTPGDVTALNLSSPAVAPGGQVSTGFQRAAGAQGSAPMSPEEAAAHGGYGGESGESTSESSLEQYGDLEDKTVHELRDIAEAEEIDLRGATRKDEILKAIRKK